MKNRNFGVVMTIKAIVGNECKCLEYYGDDIDHIMHKVNETHETYDIISIVRNKNKT